MMGLDLIKDIQAIILPFMPDYADRVKVSAKLYGLMADKLYSYWNIEDIKHQDNSLTDEQCLDVMRYIIKTHDACIGINWDVIDCAIGIIKGEKNST